MGLPIGIVLMPIYEYKCPQCEHVFEEWLKSHVGVEQADCPKCGTESGQIISNTSFVLKGGGWYVTEYGGRKNQENNGDSQTHTTSETAPKQASSTDEKSTPKDEAKTSTPKAESKVSTEGSSASTANKASVSKAAV